MAVNNGLTDLISKSDALLKINWLISVRNYFEIKIP